MLPKPSQRFPGWQPWPPVGSGGALPLQMPFGRGWAGEYGQGLLQCHGSVASPKIRFFPLHTSLMAMLHFSKQELRKSFLNFSKISQSKLRNPKSTSRSTNKVQKEVLLYATYAVECGLKYMLLVRRDLESTGQLAKEDLSHDLNYLLGKREITDRQPKLFKNMKRGEQTISSKQLHELYRYGGQLNTDSENNLIEVLSSLLITIKDKLNQLAEGRY